MTPLPMLRLILPLVLVAGTAEAADLVLKRVMLSSGGVGYFEYEAEVQGPESLALTVRRDQVDDVLKSVVVYDDKGGVGDIALPGEDPLRDVFRELPFDQAALQEPARLYNALRGAEIEIGGAAAVRGRIIGVTEEQESSPQSRTVTRQRLSVLTSDGVRSVLLHEAGPITFADPQLKTQVEQALAALVQNRARERRTLTVRTFGAGARTLRVGYVVEAPLWKASYRLTLGGGATGDLQGWAVLENRSGEDWKDVELTLVTGNPVTFRQALYTAYYVNRPEVPVEVMGRVLPRADTGTIGVMSAGSGARAAMAPPPPPAAAAPMARGMLAEQAYAPKRAADIMAAESQEATTQASYTIPKPASVANGHSLLVPLVARAVPTEQIALYQRQPPQHPLAAVRITNDSGVSLPPGVLTLYERGPRGAAAFVGDARLGPLPAGEKRLLSYAVDQKITVQRKEEETTTLSRARLTEGVLRSTLVARRETTFDIAGASGEGRKVLIDHPQAPGFEIVEPRGGVEKGDFGYRLPLTLEAGKPARLTVVEEQTLSDSVALADMRQETFLQYASNARLTEAQRKAFNRLAELAAARSAAAETTRRLAGQRKDLETEQARVRSNLGAVPANSDIHRRYLGLLNEQEDSLGRIDADLGKARDAEAAAERAVAEYARSLDL